MENNFQIDKQEEYKIWIRHYKKNVIVSCRVGEIKLGVKVTAGIDYKKRFNQAIQQTRISLTVLKRAGDKIKTIEDYERIINPPYTQEDHKIIPDSNLDIEIMEFPIIHWSEGTS